MDPIASTSNQSKPKKQRASTSTKNRARSPSPYRSTAETNQEDFMQEFWNHTLQIAENHEDDFKHQALPLARIKKVAKMDPDVQMISSEVTVLFEKACQIFIQELTARAHLVSIESKRRTISRTDVAQAVSKSDTFDFLIDIVPREERAAAVAGGGGSAATSGSTSHQPPPPTSHAHQTRTSINVPQNALYSPTEEVQPPLTASGSNSTTNTTTTSNNEPVNVPVTSGSRRPARTRKISEKARQAEAEAEEQQNGGVGGGVYMNRKGSGSNGSVDLGNHHHQAMVEIEGNGGVAVAQEHERERDQPMFFGQETLPLSDQLTSYDQHQDKRSRIDAGGQNGAHQPPQGSGAEEEDEEEEEEDEELEGDGAFEGWEGLKLGFQ